MKKLIVLICLLLPMVVLGQFEQDRVAYEVEYRLKGSIPDTTINIDSTGVIELTAFWDAVTGFGYTVIAYDDSTHWKSFARTSETVVTDSIEVGNGIYSFRVWSEYIWEDGSIGRSLSPSPEFLVEFILPKYPPERVFMRMRFKAKQ